MLLTFSVSWHGYLSVECGSNDFLMVQPMPMWRSLASLKPRLVYVVHAGLLRLSRVSRQVSDAVVCCLVYQDYVTWLLELSWHSSRNQFWVQKEQGSVSDLFSRPFKLFVHQAALRWPFTKCFHSICSSLRETWWGEGVFLEWGISFGKLYTPRWNGCFRWRHEWACRKQ